VNIGLGQGGKVSPIGSGRQESPQGVDSGVIGAADQRRDSPLQDSLVGTPIPSVRWEAQLTRAKQAGFGHTVEVLGYLVNTPHGIRPTDIDSLFGVLTPTLTKEGRRELVLSYEPIDADLSYMLAAALTLDLSDPGLFRELLVRGAQKQIGVNRSPLDVTSTFALMVAIPSVREFFLDDATKDSLTLSKDDTWWIFETLIAQRAEQLPKFVRSTRMNQLAEGPRRFFVLSLGQVADPEGVPMAALFRSARNGPTAADVQQFSQWFDPMSVQALLAALLTSSEAQVITNALDALANKSTGSRPLDAALAFMNNNVAALRVYYARFIGAVGLVEGLSVEERRDALASIRGKPQTSQLCKIVLQASDATLARAILDAFGNDMNPALLVDLLQHPDKGVRLQVIPFVKSVQLASSWQQVVNSYLAELDPEVKSRYETEIPRMRGS